MKSLAEKCTTTITDMPSGGQSDRADTYIKMIDLSNEINKDIDTYCDMRKEIESAIETVQDLTLQTLLRYRYIDGLTFEQIAVYMNYCWRQIIRLHGIALSQINVSCFVI